MTQITIKQLLEAGVHFGHQTRRWNPKMKPYIFGERNGIYIINLENTLSCLERALNFLKKTAAEGKEILWVGTKRQAQEALREAAQRCGMPYVHERWLGGMLTNFETVRKSIHRLDLIDQMEKDGSFQFVTKKEVSSLKKEREKLQRNLSGVRNMTKLPAALFIIDSRKEEIAVQEAAKLRIPIAAVLDTNCDPGHVDYPIPGNDDAIRAVKLFCDVVAEAVSEGRNQFLQFVTEEQLRRAEEARDEEALAAVTDEAGDGEEAVEPVEAGGTETAVETVAERFSEETEEGKTARGKVKKSTKKETPRGK